MADENLNRNKFWQALNAKEHRALFARVEDNSLIVAVPVAASMPQHVVYDKYYLESHIFEASTFFEGEYLSANKKTVLIDDKSITTKRGYPEKRAVAILAQESFYSSKPDPFRVLFLDSPLEGPSKRVEQPIDLPETRSFDEINLFLMTFPENKLVLQKLQREIDQFNHSYLLVQGFESHAVEKVRAICDTTLEQLVCANPDFRKLYNGTDRQLAALSGLVDSYCLGKLHAKLFSGLRGIHREADQLALARLRRLQEVDAALLGVALSPLPDLAPAVELLGELDVRVSPLAKLELLCDVQAAVTQVLGGGSRVGGATGNNNLSTDDMLPLMVLVAVRAAPAYLSTTVAYITLFCLAETMPPHLAYQLTTLHAVHEYVMGDQVTAVLPSSLPPLRELPAETEADTSTAALVALGGAHSDHDQASAGTDDTASLRSSDASVIFHEYPPAPLNKAANDKKTKDRPSVKSVVVAPDVIELNDDRSGLGEFLSSLKSDEDASSSKRASKGLSLV